MSLRSRIANWLVPQMKNAVYPDWALAMADNEKYNIPSLDLPRRQAELYQRLSWVAIATGHVANEAAGTPMEVKQETGEDEESIPNHPFEILMKRPNPMMSQFELKASTFLWYSLTGNGYWWMNRSNENAPPSEIWLIPSDKIEPVPDGNMYLKGYAYDPGDGRKIALEPWEIAHFKRFNPINPYVGMSAIEALAVVAIGDMKMQEWNTEFFGKNNAKMPGILSFADPIPDSEWQRLLKETKEQHGGTKRQMMMMRNVGVGGVAWTAMQASQKDMEFLSGREFNQAEIYDMLAPGLNQWLSPDTTSTNAQSGRDAFMELAIWPLHQLVSEVITNTILPSYGDNLIAEFDDVRPKDRALILQEQEAFASVHTIDEVRAQYYQADEIGDERGDLLKAEITSQGQGGFPGTDIIEKEEPEIDNKAIERKQFKAFAEKRVKQGKLEKIQAFEFRHLDWTEGEMLKAQYKPDDNADLIASLDTAVKALRADTEAQNVEVNITMPPQTINLPEPSVSVEAAKQSDINVVVQPAEVPVNVDVQVDPTPVTVENEVIVPEPKPKKTKVKRDKNGDIMELETE